jgi:hypothetical protein
MSAQVANFLFSTSNFLATPYERKFEYKNIQTWVSNHWEVPIIAVTSYLLFCYYGQKYLQDKKPFDLRLLLAAWNASLSLFSFIGMFRTVPFLLGQLLSMTYEKTVCSDPDVTYGNGPVGLWVALFILSKLPELIDSVFIVLRKRDLIFLHWYHHVTVLLYCWHAYSTRAGSGLYFVAMNYSVHALMYGYFCLQALKMVPKNFPAYLITFAQITQMIVGTSVCVSTWYFHVSEKQCHNDFYNLIAGGLMYGSYLYLFVEFAFKRFVPSNDKKSSKKLE